MTITVTGTNDVPVASNDSHGTGENAVLTASVPAATDVDGTVASYALVTVRARQRLASRSTATAATASPRAATSTTGAGATRDVSFTYTATDNNGGVSAPATVTITVTGTNDLPIASDTTATAPARTPSSPPACLAATDVDGTIAGYSLVTGPASGSLTLQPRRHLLASTRARPSTTWPPAPRVEVSFHLHRHRQQRRRQRPRPR